MCENDAILIFEVGYEKLRYVVGCCTVITSTDMQCVDIQQQAVGKIVKPPKLRYPFRLLNAS